MGSVEFDELVQLQRERSQAQMAAGILERQLRRIIRLGTRGNCPPGQQCKRGVTRNCEACWLAFAGLAPLPVERERERRF